MQFACSMVFGCLASWRRMVVIRFIAICTHGSKSLPCEENENVRSLDLAMDLEVIQRIMAVRSALTVDPCGVHTSHPYSALGSTRVRINIALSACVSGSLRIFSTVHVASFIRLSSVSENLFAPVSIDAPRSRKEVSVLIFPLILCQCLSCNHCRAVSELVNIIDFVAEILAPTSCKNVCVCCVKCLLKPCEVPAPNSN